MSQVCEIIDGDFYRYQLHVVDQLSYAMNGEDAHIATASEQFGRIKYYKKLWKGVMTMSGKLAIHGGEKLIQKAFIPYRSIGEEEVKAAAAVVESGVLSQFIGRWGEQDAERRTKSPRI